MSLRISRQGCLALVFLGSTAAIATAFAFEHLGGYMPCALCYRQRIPFYVVMTLSIMGLVFPRLMPESGQRLASIVLAGILATLVVSIGLGVHHAGVEWKWWAGPAGCAISFQPLATGNLLEQIDTFRPPSCTEASIRILGLSFAGWNVVASTMLAAFVAWAVSPTWLTRKRRRVRIQS